MRLKRLFDIAVSVPGLVLSAVPIAGISAVMYLDTKASPFFLQERPGKDGKPFMILKIRTMREAFNTAGQSLPDKQRVSKLGILLRRTHLDELPQFWNVLKGDMSFVGPRPWTPDLPG